MDSSVGVFEAKTHPSDLIDRAERGENIVITRRGKAVARLGPVGPTHDVAAAMKAVEALKQFQASLSGPPVTAAEIREMIEEGRR